MKWFKRDMRAAGHNTRAITSAMRANTTAKQLPRSIIRITISVCDAERAGRISQIAQPHTTPQNVLHLRPCARDRMHRKARLHHRKP